MTGSERSSEQDISLLLTDVGNGDQRAASKLAPLVYRELRRLAAHYVRKEKAGYSLQPTELVHEAYLRVVKNEQVEWQGRLHFLAIAARSMRQILVERARRRKSGRHGGGQDRLVLDEALLFAPERSSTLVALDDALKRLEQIAPRQSRVVELHIFGGLKFKEVAALEHLALRTAEDDWKAARLWLRREIAKQQ